MGKKAKYSKSHKRGFFDYVGIYLKGACMGAADVVPGVSGGTIALILRVYVELVDSLKAIFSKDLLHIFRRGGFRQYPRGLPAGLTGGYCFGNPAACRGHSPPGRALPGAGVELFLRVGGGIHLPGALADIEVEVVHTDFRDTGDCCGLFYRNLPCGFDA